MLTVSTPASPSSLKKAPQFPLTSVISNSLCTPYSNPSVYSLPRHSRPKESFLLLFFALCGDYTPACYILFDFFDTLFPMWLHSGTNLCIYGLHHYLHIDPELVLDMACLIFFEYILFKNTVPM